MKKIKEEIIVDFGYLPKEISSISSADLSNYSKYL
jgi:hypothetical protein